jgi:hypothetical protein
MPRLPKPFSATQFSQRGYLLEIPILVVVALVVLSVLMPVLPPLGQQVLVCLVAAVVLFGLFYMIVIPGWMPTDTHRLRPPWSILVFLLVAAVVLFFTVAIVIGINKS